MASSIELVEICFIIFPPVVTLYGWTRDPSESDSPLIRAWNFSAGGLALDCWRHRSRNYETTLFAFSRLPIMVLKTNYIISHFVIKVNGFAIFLQKKKAADKSQRFSPGGENRIRTCESLSTQHAFQACALNHSAISPRFLILSNFVKVFNKNPPFSGGFYFYKNFTNSRCRD